MIEILLEPVKKMLVNYFFRMLFFFIKTGVTLLNQLDENNGVCYFHWDKFKIKIQPQVFNY